MRYLMTGNEARAIRRSLRLSAREMGLVLGTNESSIYRWEWRKREYIPRHYAVALHHFLEHPPSRDEIEYEAAV